MPGARTIDGEIEVAYRLLYAAADNVQRLLIERYLRAKKAEAVLNEKYGEVK